MNSHEYDSILFVEIWIQIAKHSVIKTKKKQLLQIRVEKICIFMLEFTALERIDYWKVIVEICPLPLKRLCINTVGVGG